MCIRDRFFPSYSALSRRRWGGRPPLPPHFALGCKRWCGRPTLPPYASAGAGFTLPPPVRSGAGVVGRCFADVVAGGVLAKRAPREEETFPRVLFSPRGNALPPEMQFPRIAKILNFKIMVCRKSYVSPSEAGGLKSSPPVRPHVMTHNFA